MKTIVWATLSANGNYAQSSPENPPKKEALDDFAKHAMAAGNFIVGRRTFESMAAGGGGGPFADLDIVVVSRNLESLPGATIAGSPEEALNYLRHKGHRTAIVAAGADLHNAFLSQGLADELIFNIAPVLEGKGLHLTIDPNHYSFKDIELLNANPLGGGVVQLHYAVNF
ncbi:dihydrofolate reductase family protein [Paenibacillus sacheonensis]|uniref:Dihydrofolate reductase n=1 Tax=Paenibacillus sacheonensis TaxID=742054 RepID=A0A7X4YQ88_9BACL|nr:dihydrofolate reductase [Paenibacillus sacheonensis]MBM7566308.1 dihydrofolate reductase [Paenibacillus sacheonensis]NBC70512.1 dihydrofolate reductase [Paenibacillus sacheonensis]